MITRRHTMIIGKKHIDLLVRTIMEGPEDWEEYYGKPYQPIAQGWTPDELGSALVFLLRTAVERRLLVGYPKEEVPGFLYEQYRYEPPKRRLTTLEFLRALHGFETEADDSPYWAEDQEGAHHVVMEHIQWVTNMLLDHYSGGEYLRLPLYYGDEQEED
jgi:hypothetical protein